MTETPTMLAGFATHCPVAKESCKWCQDRLKTSLSRLPRICRYAFVAPGQESCRFQGSESSLIRPTAVANEPASPRFAASRTRKRRLFALHQAWERNSGADRFYRQPEKAGVYGSTGRREAGKKN